MDLFDDDRAAKRDRLWALGWVSVPVNDGTYWKRPDGVVLVEEEAFRWLEREYQE